MNITAEKWMRDALSSAAAASALGEVPVGAVVVQNGQLIASAHNETEKAHDATSHAEILAIRRAGEKLGRWRLDDCELYVTMEPCPMCIGAILLSRISKLYFGCYDERMGAVGSLFDLTSHEALAANIEVFPQLLEHDCRDVLQQFFKKRR